MHEMKKTAVHATLTIFVVATAGLFIVVPFTAHANHCWDGESGYPDSLHLANGDCPPNTPDPGFSPPPVKQQTPPAAQPQTGTIFSILVTLSFIVAAVIPFIMALTMLAIIWGVFRYIASGDEEEKRAEGKKFVIYGIVGLFIMVSIWGLVNLLKGTLHLNPAPANIPALPAIPGA